MAAVISLRTVPDIRDAQQYLHQQGYICIGIHWLRGQRDYARLEHTITGAIRIVEGVA